MSCGYRYDRKTKTHFWMPDCVGGANSDCYCTCGTESELKRQAAERADRMADFDDRLMRIEAALSIKTPRRRQPTEKTQPS